MFGLVFRVKGSRLSLCEASRRSHSPILSLLVQLCCVPLHFSVQRSCLFSRCDFKALLRGGMSQYFTEKVTVF